MSRTYEVQSGTYAYQEIVCEYGGPTYDVADWCEIVADSPHDAKWMAYNSAEFSGWRRFQEDNELHPLHGFTAKRIRGRR